MQGCEHHRNKIDGRVRFIFLQNASPMMTLAVIMLCKKMNLTPECLPHDDRKGHPYYTRWLHRPTQACIVGMTLAVIMLCKKINITPDCLPHDDRKGHPYYTRWLHR